MNHLVMCVMTQTAAEISIIIPVLNEQKGIDFFLKHLQKFRPNCQLIIVDGGSDDNTVELARPYVDKVLQSPTGRAQQMNRGAKEAVAPILLFLHADTFLPDDAVIQIKQAIARQYRWGRFDIKLMSSHPALTIIAYFMNWRSKLTGIVTGDQAIFVEKDFFETSGAYPDIALMEDVALSKKLNKVAKPCSITSKVSSSARRWLQFGIVKMTLLMWWLRLRYFLGSSPSSLAQLYKEGLFWKR